MKIINYQGFVNEIKKSETEIVWNLINSIADELKNSKDFYPYWELEKTFPKFKGIKEKINDSIIVPLHNKNKVVKKTTLEQRIVMFLMSWNEINKQKDIYINTSFKEWFYNSDVLVYRGIPDSSFKTPNLKVDDNKFVSTSIDINSAIKFTQLGWAGRSWVSEKNRNGWVLMGTIKPCNIHIFNNEAGEFEAVIQGSYTFEEYLKIEKNEIIL